MGHSDFVIGNSVVPTDLARSPILEEAPAFILEHKPESRGSNRTQSYSMELGKFQDIQTAQRQQGYYFLFSPEGEPSRAGMRAQSTNIFNGKNLSAPKSLIVGRLLPKEEKSSKSSGQTPHNDNSPKTNNQPSTWDENIVLLVSGAIKA